jgi:hypothetical protein
MALLTRDTLQQSTHAKVEFERHSQAFDLMLPLPFINLGVGPSLFQLPWIAGVTSRGPNTFVASVV